MTKCGLGNNMILFFTNLFHIYAFHNAILGIMEIYKLINVLNALRYVLLVSPIIFVYPVNLDTFYRKPNVLTNVHQ